MKLVGSGRRFGIRILSNALLCTILLAVFFSAGQVVLASGGGIAVSGTFANQTYQVVQGESLESSDVFIVFINNYDRPIQLELTPEGPAGVVFELDARVVSVESKGRVQVPVRFTVETYVSPGNYQIGIAALVVPETLDGVVVAGAAELVSTLTVFGEAGTVRVRTVDLFGNPYPLPLRLVRVKDGLNTPVVEDPDGTLEQRVSPGHYLVTATLGTQEVARKEFDVAADQVLEFDLTVQTVFIRSFSVQSLYREDAKTLYGFQIDFSVENLAEPLEDVSYLLIVEQNGKPFDSKEMFAVGSLGTEVQEYSSEYILPDNGTPLSAGEYRFSVEVRVKGQQVGTNVLAASRNDQVIQLDNIRNDSWLWGAVLLAIAALSWLLFFLLTRKRCRSCRGKGEIVCSECHGQGTFVDEDVLMTTCPRCEGKGKHACPSCGSRKNEDGSGDQ